MNTRTVEQMAKQYYWSMLGARQAAGAAATSLRSWPPPSHGSGSGSGEPSWEELAFARDAAGHLGGCVWPPLSYTCTFCRREFRSAQALGGHMNVHRRDRARLRQCASPSPPDHDVVVGQQEPISTAADHHRLLQPLQESPLFRAKAVFISAAGGPKPTTTCYDHHQTTSCNKEEPAPAAVITTSPSYISAVIKETKNKVAVISIPAAATAVVGEEEEEEILVAERRKRRRVNQSPESPPPPPLLLWPLASSPERVVEHDDAKLLLPQVITNPSSLNSLHLAARQEVDLELRLGSIYS